MNVERAPIGVRNTKIDSQSTASHHEEMHRTMGRQNDRICIHCGFYGSKTVSEAKVEFMLKGMLNQGTLQSLKVPIRSGITSGTCLIGQCY